MQATASGPEVNHADSGTEANSLTAGLHVNLRQVRLHRESTLQVRVGFWVHFNLSCLLISNRYLRNHGKETVKQLWAKKDFMDIVAMVRRQSRRDIRGNPSIPAVAEKDAPVEQQQDSLYTNVMWYLDNGKDSDAHYRLKYALYQDAYEKEKVVTHVYTDCARNLQKWKAEGIKIFIFSHAWVNTQQLFMKKTNHGPLFELIDGFFDGKSIGQMSDPSSYQQLLQKIGIEGKDVLFLTKDVGEGRAAKASNIHSVLVISHGHQLKRYNQDDLKEFERIRSFDELVWNGEDPSGIAAPSGGSGVASQTAPKSGSGSAVGSAAVASGATGATGGGSNEGGSSTGSKEASGV